jgi:hypothetical protein
VRNDLPPAVQGAFDLAYHRDRGDRDNRRDSGAKRQRKEDGLLVLLQDDLPLINIAQNLALLIFAFPQADRPTRQLIQEYANTFSFIGDGADEQELRAFGFDRLRHWLRQRRLQRRGGDNRCRWTPGGQENRPIARCR